MSEPTIELLFYPSFTMAPNASVSGRSAQAVVSLMIRDTHFADVAKVVWVAAVRCYLDRLVPPNPDGTPKDDGWKGRRTRIYRAEYNSSSVLRLGKPYPEVNSDSTFPLNGNPIFNGPGLRESLRATKTLARGHAGESLDAAMIAELLSRNFAFILRGFEPVAEADSTPAIDNTGMFPMVPGLVLSKPDGDVDFRYLPEAMRNSDFEDRFELALKELWGQAEPGTTTSTGESRGVRSLAELAFEQYFDRLLSAATDLFDKGCELWFRKNPNSPSRELGSAIDNPFDDSDPAAILPRYRNLMAQVSADFCSGLRIPIDFDQININNPDSYKGFYSWTGQQFELPAVPVLNPAYPYSIELKQRGTSPASWITIDPPPRRPQTTVLNGVEIDALLQGSFAPALLSGIKELSPLQASDRRYSFSPAIRWQPAGTTDIQSLWPMPSAMRREIRGLVEEIRDSASVRIDCRMEMAGDQNSNDDANSLPLTSAKWATIVPLMIRQVADTTNAGGGKVGHLYEIVGMSEKDRRLLDDIINDFDQAGLTHVDLLYQATDDKWSSDSIDLDPQNTECLLFRTNISTESNPGATVNISRAASDINGEDIASLGSTKGFIWLLQNACIVNSGGYFLRYEPATSSHPEQDPLKELFGSASAQQRQQVMLTIVYGSVAASPYPKPYYNAIDSDTPDDDPERDPLAFAFLERKDAANRWHRLIQHDVRFAPGSIGFRATRPRVAKPTSSDPNTATQAAFQLDNLFSRLGYSIDTPPRLSAGVPTQTDIDDLNASRFPQILISVLAEYRIYVSSSATLSTTTVGTKWRLVDVSTEFELRLENGELFIFGVFRQFPMTLPIQPREPGRSFDGNRTRSIDSQNWHWEHVLQVNRFPFDCPYAGIGKPGIRLKTAIRDTFGNEFPADPLGPTEIRPQLVYFDKLTGVAEWPAAKTELRAVGTSQNPSLAIEISAIPFGTGTVGGTCTAVPPDAKRRIVQRYQEIQKQLADKVVVCRLYIYSNNGTASGTPIFVDCKQQLMEFVDRILNLATSSSSPCTRVDKQIPLGIPIFDHPGDFFRLQFSLDIFRQAPDDHFATVCFPWKRNAQDECILEVFAPARRVASPVGLPSTPRTAAESPLRSLAEAFETIYSKELLLGTVEGDERDRDLWLVRRERLQPEILRFTPPQDSSHLVFAAMPLSTELMWRRITNLPGDVAYGGASVDERIFADIDLDVRTRDCFAAMERFLDPATASLVVKASGSSSWQDGWKSFQALMNAKRKLSLSAPEQYLSDLFVNGPTIGPCVRASALAAFQQRVLSKLTGFYEVDGLFPFRVVPPSSLTADLTGGGVAIYGKVHDRTEQGTLSARTSDSTGAITMESPGHGIQVGAQVDLAWSDNQDQTVNSRDAEVVSVAGAVVSIRAMTPPVLPPQGAGVSVSLVPQSRALNYRNNKIRYFPRTCQNAYNLVVVVDQPPATPGRERRQPAPRSLTFQWTHVEFDLPEPLEETGCCHDNEFPISRWISLVNPVSITIDGGRECELPLPVREFPFTPRIVNHQAHSPVLPTSIETARNWEYRLNIAVVMDSVDELEITAKLNVPPPPARFAFANADQICDAVLKFQAAFPKPDDSFNVLRTELSTGSENGLLIAQKFAEWAWNIASSFGNAARFTPVLRSGPEQRDVRYNVFDTYIGSAGSNLRESRIEWDVADDDLKAIIRPEHNLSVVPTPLAHGNKVEFTETLAPNQAEAWRDRRITIADLNALKYESCASDLVLYRNRHIVPVPGNPTSDKYLVNTEFVYATPVTKTPSPVVALIDVTNPIPLYTPPISPPLVWPSLTDHLKSLFTRFFADLDPSADKRLIRCELKYSFPANQFADPSNSTADWSLQYGIRSAQRLLPPTNVNVSNPDNTVRDLVQNLVAWKNDFDPDLSGAIVIDLLAYSILSTADLDRPLVRVRNIVLPLLLIEQPWS